MINLTVSKLISTSVHYVGNRNNDDRVIISSNPLNLEDESFKKILRDYFVESFNGKEELFRFTHTTDLIYNEIFNYSKDIFHNSQLLHFYSIKIAKFLLDKTLHPKIKSGEIYVGLLTDCIIDGEVVEAVTIFKSEKKQPFLSVLESTNNIEISYTPSGVNVDKVDKACIIFNSKEENGFKICVIDNTNKPDTQYWRENFLNIKPISNDYSLTSDFLGTYRSFINNQIENNLEFNSVDRADLLNKSLKYFKTESQFDIEDFSEKVLQNEELNVAFRKYRNEVKLLEEIVPNDNFNISPSAFKKQSRKLKNVLKLDKNFDIYIHGGRELIERGTDLDGRKYYKIYFNNEI